ncbi:hypothetical protein [Ruegeria sp. ANG-R]|uniref:COG4648 family protein n=1 Tax=Ruegeria sp. ANG-R TaxID=1577903 RepID=UPI000690157E|nr:hypothetical protein [Ruegeria sp. ANG-R]
MTLIRASLSFLLAACLVAFPFAAFWFSSFEHPYWLFAAAVALSILRFATAGRVATDLLVPQLVFYLGVMAMAFLAAKDQAYLLHPFAMSGSFALIFGISLSKEQSLIETFARLREPDLPASGVVFTRKLTRIWFVFLILNSIVAAITALFAPIEVWVFYNGILFYCLSGVLMVSDFLYRGIFAARA